jgi:hypothetical protein
MTRRGNDEEPGSSQSQRVDHLLVLIKVLRGFVLSVVYKKRRYANALDRRNVALRGPEVSVVMLEPAEDFSSNTRVHMFAGA